MTRLLTILAGACFALLCFCAVFHALYLAGAWVVEMATSPPACVVRLAWPFPYARCAGLAWSDDIDYALSLPGALLALPMIVFKLWRLAPPGMAMTIAAGMAVHALGWGYALYRLASALAAWLRR